jgi:sugar O-acyltransferase (sialic acid O-acetyltransferase NeuD family)
MKKIVVFGISILSQMLFYDAAGRKDFEIACFTVDKEYLNGSEFSGLPLVDFQDIDRLYPADEYDMIVVLGERHMRNREKAFLRAKEKGYLLRNYVSPKADFSPEIRLGENNLILAFSHMGIGGSLGNNNMVRQNVYMGHNFMVGDHNFISPGCNIGGFSTIKNKCYIGLGATIINSITIEEETLVGAGAVIIKNTEPFSKNVGNPSRVIGYHKEEGINLYGSRE